MRMPSFCFVVVTLLVSAVAAAQGSTPQTSTLLKTMTIFGTVSDDGKTLVAKNSRTWSVTNPDKLAGREGHRVKIKCRVYAGGTDILVLSVKLTDDRTQYAANQSDSAFRR